MPLKFSKGSSPVSRPRLIFADVNNPQPAVTGHLTEPESPAHTGAFAQVVACPWFVPVFRRIPHSVFRARVRWKCLISSDGQVQSIVARSSARGRGQPRPERFGVAWATALCSRACGQGA